MANFNMDDIKSKVREAVEKEERGEEVKRIKAEDPMILKEDDPDAVSYMNEMVTDQQEGDLPLVDLAQTDNKPEAEKEETTEEVETKTPQTEGIAETGSESQVSAIPDQDNFSEKLFRVKTVYGEEELPLREIISGYMKGADYTQSKQKIAAEKNMIRDLLRDPRNLLDYAVQNGLDLRQYFKPEESIEVNLPELDEMATDTEKTLHGALGAVLQQNKRLEQRYQQLEGNIFKQQNSMKADEAEKEFMQKRGDIPETAAHAVYAMYEIGRRKFPNRYTMDNALIDYRKAEGNIVERWMNSPQFKEWEKKQEPLIIQKYLNAKKADMKATMSPDMIPATKKAPSAKIEKPQGGFSAWVQKAKRDFGIAED